MLVTILGRGPTPGQVTLETGQGRVLKQVLRLSFESKDAFFRHTE